MQFTLTEEQQMIQSTATKIAENEFADSAFEWGGKFPHENVPVLVENELLGIALPEQYGGGGFTPVEALLAVEAVGRICPETAHVLSRSSLGPPRVIASLGSEHLKETYLPDVCTGDRIFSVAISETEAGSDATKMRTTARKEGDKIVLNGQKSWITKGTVANSFLVYARFEADNRIGAVVIDEDATGLTISDGYENMAGGVQTDLYFDDCTVPNEQILAHEPDAFKKLITEFNVERCHNAMMCVACGLNALDKALEYARNREQFGKSIADHQGIEWKFADMALKLDAARLLIYRAASNANVSDPSRLETSMAKVMANEAGQYVVDEALQIHGAAGYMDEHPLAHLYRLVRGWKIAGGTVEIQRNNIAKVLKKNGFN